MVRLTWDLPAEAEHIRLCRHLARLTLQHLDIDEPEIEDIELAIGELCSNVVRHAKLAPDKTFFVELDARPTSVVLSVTDLGIGFTPAITEEPTPTESGGLGLWLVEQLTDRLEFAKTNGDGVTVRAVRNFSPQARRDRETARRDLPIPEAAPPVPS